MELRLSPIQAELLKLAREKGYITLDDIACFWSSPSFQKTNLKRFIFVGILKPSVVGNRFDYNGNKT